eukprot:scaffold67512_cov48-Phaeocystis_antarctica.AAC.2
MPQAHAQLDSALQATLLAYTSLVLDRLGANWRHAVSLTAAGDAAARGSRRLWIRAEQPARQRGSSGQV